MRKLVVSEFVSLDGVAEGPGGDDGFVRGPWTVPYWGEELAAYKQAEHDAADALLIGRRTYETFAGAWPDRSGDALADAINGMAKYVVSRTLTDPTWAGTEVLTGDLVAEVEARKARPGGDILVSGSISLVHALLAADLVDELRLAIYPILLGTGQRLFAEGDRRDFVPVETSVTATGVQLVTLRRAEAPSAVGFDYDEMRSRG